jgi:tetratricopeptide (TPR) repeat protein
MGNWSKNSEKMSETDKILCRAEELRDRSAYRQSLNLFRKALREYTRVHDEDSMIHCMLSMGDTYRMTGDFELAVTRYRDAIETARKIKSPVKVADAKIGLGLALRALGRWKEALKLIRESKGAYVRRHDREGLAFSLWAEAGAFRIKGDIREAIRTYKESYKVFRAIKDDSGIGYCLCGLGGASRVAGLFGDSLDYYKKGNSLFSSIGDKFGKAYSYCGTGNAYRMLEDYEKAFAHFKKAVTLYKKMGDRVSYAYTLWGLGTAHKMIGDLKKAHSYLTDSMKLFRRTKDPRGVCYCRLGLGEIALLRGNKAVAGKNISAARETAVRNNFGIEKCYVKTMLGLMDGKIDNTCYNQLGLKIRFRGLPLNIP